MNMVEDVSEANATTRCRSETEEAVTAQKKTIVSALDQS